MTKRTQFQRVRNDGRAKAGRFVVLSTLEDAGLPHLMVGVITTRRVGKAHDRNLLRRRIRAMLQRHGHLLADPLRYLVTIPRPGSAVATYAELEADWLKQASRLGLLKSSPASPPPPPPAAGDSLTNP